MWDILETFHILPLLLNTKTKLKIQLNFIHSKSVLLLPFHWFLLIQWSPSILNFIYLFSIVLIFYLSKSQVVVHVIPIDEGRIGDFIVSHFHPYNLKKNTSEFDCVNVHTKIPNSAHLIQNQKQLIFVCLSLKLQTRISSDVKADQWSLKSNLILIDILWYLLV